MRIAPMIASSSTLPVPNVSTRIETGSATPIAYDTCTSSAAGGPGGHQVLGDPARGVGCGAVDLRGVLAREGAAAVAAHAAVGVDDDLAAGETGVPDRAAHDEAAGRDSRRCACRRRSVSAGIRGGSATRSRARLRSSCWMSGVCCVESTMASMRSACRRRTPRSPATWRRDAGTRARPRLAQLLVLHHQPVRERDRHGHQLLGLARRRSRTSSPGRRPPAPCTAPPLRSTPWEMSFDCSSRATRTPQDSPSKPSARVVVADVEHRLAHHGRDVDVRLARHLARHDHEAGLDERLAGHAARGVARR